MIKRTFNDKLDNILNFMYNMAFKKGKILDVGVVSNDYFEYNAKDHEFVIYIMDEPCEYTFITTMFLRHYSLPSCCGNIVVRIDKGTGDLMLFCDLSLIHI